LYQIIYDNLKIKLVDKPYVEQHGIFTRIYASINEGAGVITAGIKTTAGG